MLALPLLLMARPVRGYRELAAKASPPSLSLGALRFLGVLGALVSVSATGRFAPFEMLMAMVSFSWLPLVHAIALAATVRVFAPAFGWRRAFAYYLEGIGPWLLLFLIFIGGVLFAPHSERPQLVLWTPLVAVAAVWSIYLSYALFRGALGLGRGRAIAATFAFWIGNHVLILGYFLAVGQLWPIL